ncbi:MAG: tetratricopeptide repeat protein [Betaproteobacteria bacterium]
MGEKKRRQAAGQGGLPRHDGRLIARAFAALERGDRGAAADAFDALLAAPPSEPDALNAVGVLALQLGDAPQAEALLTRATERNPRDPAYRCHLAIAYRRLGKTDLAIDALGVALLLDPQLAEAHSNLGNLLRERGDNESAARSFGRALAIRPEFADALNGLGQTELARRNFDAACASFERALALDRRFHEAWYNLSRARTDWASAIEEGAGDEAAPAAAGANAAAGRECILAALELDRDNWSYWMQFENCVRNLDLRQPVDPRVLRALARAIDHPDVDPTRLIRPIVSLATSGADVLGDPLMQRLFEVTVIPNAPVQALVAGARRALLDECSAGAPGEASLPLPTVVAMAHQAFNTEYSYEESVEEREGVAALRCAIASARVSGVAVPLRAYAIYACYRPLDTLDGAVEIAARLASSPLRALAARQIDEPREERRLRATIPVLTGSVDAVSAAVQRQYEANPYPRWQRVRRGAAHASVAGYLRERFPEADLAGIAVAPARILVAGCGTGRHPVGTALAFPDATVLAVDLSLASLAFAKRRTQELSIANVEYRQADILAMGTIVERFDVVECTGVLHHLKDPVAGWRILCSLLRPVGVMRIGLYSEIARRHVVRAREFVAEQGFAATSDGIRACRAAILARRDDERFARLVRGEDFYSLSGCRDLVFHAQEQRFTLPQIARLLPDLGLRLIGFELPDGGAAAAYRARFPDDRAMADLDRWHEVETARPDTFALMYQFWVRRLD